MASERAADVINVPPDLLRTDVSAVRLVQTALGRTPMKVQLGRLGCFNHIVCCILKCFVLLLENGSQTEAGSGNKSLKFLLFTTLNQTFIGIFFAILNGVVLITEV